MPNLITGPSIEHSFDNVKTRINYQLPLFPDNMIHHNISREKNKRIVYPRGINPSLRYGVSRSRRVLSPQLFLKRYDRVRDLLEYQLGMSPGQREAALRLLRFWAYYGNVYAKESTLTAEPGCSKATYWRTVRILKDLGLVDVINRYILRPHAQISNLYRFDKLLIIIARYLAEHGVQFKEKFLQPYISMPGSVFWTSYLAPPAPS